jgi:hypothetical protein
MHGTRSASVGKAQQKSKQSDQRAEARWRKKAIIVDTSGIEPDTFRKVTEVRSERDKPTTPCAHIDDSSSMESGACLHCLKP